MKKNLLFIFSFTAATFLVSCKDTSTADTKKTATDTTVIDSKTADAEIRKEVSVYQEDVKRGDSTALAAHYTSDGVVMAPNMGELKGNAITGFWGGAVRMGVKELKLNTTDISGGGDVYAETGTYEMVGAGNKTMDNGKYIVVWKRENGNWKIFRDIFNSNMPMPSAK